jgi:hypothetical protein
MGRRKVWETRDEFHEGIMVEIASNGFGEKWVGVKSGMVVW